MREVVFPEAARADRREITAATLERFGIGQARRLRDRIRATVEAPAISPLMDRSAEGLDPPGHRFRYSVVLERFIVCEPTENGIRIARLLHGARNVADELARDAGDSETGPPAR